MAEYYLGDTPYWLEKVALELEQLPPHLKTKGKPLGLWETGKKADANVGHLAGIRRFFIMAGVPRK